MATILSRDAQPRCSATILSRDAQPQYSAAMLSHDAHSCDDQHHFNTDAEDVTSVMTGTSVLALFIFMHTHTSALLLSGCCLFATSYCSVSLSGLHTYSLTFKSTPRIRESRELEGAPGPPATDLLSEHLLVSARL